MGLCPYERECLAVATSTSNTWRFCLLVDFIASESSDVRDKVGLCSYKRECLAIATNMGERHICLYVLCFILGAYGLHCSVNSGVETKWDFVPTRGSVWP